MVFTKYHGIRPLQLMVWFGLGSAFWFDYFCSQDLVYKIVTSITCGCVRVRRPLYILPP